MDTYGIIGYPLEHSFSRSYFNEKFENEGIDAQYLNFEIANIAELPQILAEHPELKGFNVTSPYKEQVLLFLDEMDKDALASVRSMWSRSFLKKEAIISWWDIIQTVLVLRNL